MAHPLTVVGCDIGTTDDDPHCGIVVLRCDETGTVTVLESPEPMGRTRGEETVKSWLTRYEADYLVVDAPLLPGSRERPTSNCFRPHESLVRSPTRPFIKRRWPTSWDDMSELLNTIQPMSCWSQRGPLSPFAEAGNDLLDVVSPLGWPLIDSYDEVQPKGTLEGFPKAMYLPLITDEQEFLRIRLLPRGQKDEEFLKLLLDSQNGRFWTRTGLRLVVDSKARLAFRDPDVICAFAMALNGVLYGRGQAGVLASWTPAFRFGHILTLAASISEPWAADWRGDRLSRNGHHYATTIIRDVACP